MNIELDKEIMDAVDRFEKALVDPSPDNFKEFEDSRTSVLTKLLSRIVIERQIRAAMDRMEEDVN